MDKPPPIAEPGRAGRGLSRRPAMMHAVRCLRALGLAAWLLATQPGRWLRLWAARRRLGAALAAHPGDLAPPASLDSLLGDRARAERRLGASSPPWPGADLAAPER